MSDPRRPSAPSPQGEGEGPGEGFGDKSGAAARSGVLSLRLAQYRSYELAELAPGGRSVALFGPNGAGKTNLLEAVSLLVPGRGLRRAGADEIARRPEAAQGGWRVRALVATPAGDAEIVTGLEPERPDGPQRRTVEIDGKPAPQTRLGGLLTQVWLTPAMDRLWTEGAGERRRFLDRMTLGFAAEHGEAAAAYERAMRERNRLLREDRADPAWLGGLEAQLARLGARIARARAAALARLTAAQGDAQEAAGALFPKAELTILGDMETRFSDAIRAGADLDLLEIDQGARLAAELGAGRARDAAAGRTLAGPHRSDLDAVYAAKAMPARACSTGEQKALLISLCLANARALADAHGTPPVLLLDEVAAHLDAGRRRALFSEVAALGAQAFMTGTGPELFADLDDAAMRVEVREVAGRSTLRPASPGEAR